MLTSDNLKIILNMERSERDEKPNAQKTFVLPDNLEKNIETEITSGPKTLKNKDNFEDNLRGDNFLNSNSGSQEPNMQEPTRLLKRQISDEGGNTQMVLGTFQAMMRPMSMSNLPSLPGSQSSDLEQQV